MRKLFIALLIVLISIVTVSATGVTSYTIAYRTDGWYGKTQDAYLPQQTVTTLGLDSPEEMAFGKDNVLYIVDTGNKRIVLFDTVTGTQKGEITNEEFEKPKGIFITPEGLIYIADSGAETVFKLSESGEIIDRYTRPTAPAFGNTNYNPKRIAVDNRGNMFLLSEGVYNGIIQLSKSGEFLGYFTSNKVSLSIKEYLQEWFFTDEQKEELQDKVPTTFSNVNIDDSGLVYTTTMGLDVEHPIKKHNTSGANMFDNDLYFDETIVDIDIDQNGIIYVAYQTGIMFVLTPDGWFIHGFGSAVQDHDVSGLFSSLQAISIDDFGNVWTLDIDKGYIQSFEPTEYANDIYDALISYEKGLYEENIDKWQELLKLNQASFLAHLSIGKNYLFLQEYERALYHFEIADAEYFYSQAFWEIRNIWLQDNVAMLLGVIVGLSMLLNVLKYVDRKKKIFNPLRKVRDKVVKIGVVADMLLYFKMIAHPLDSYYEIKRHKRVTVKSASIIYAVMFAVFLWFTYGKGFIFQLKTAEQIDIAPILFGYFSVMILFIVCNFLVTSINDGNGSLTDIYKMFAYSTAPIVLGTIISLLLSYVLTFNEVFILNFTSIVSIVWFLVYLFLGVQEIHGYRFRDAIKSVLMTILFMTIIMFVALLVFMMSNELYQFVISLFREVWRNVTS